MDKKTHNGGRRIKLSSPGELLNANHIPSIADEQEVGSQATESLQQHNKPTEQPMGLNFEDAFGHTMTNTELKEHVRKCLEMSSENRITPKNAFALKLIDCMGYYLNKQTDFSAIACTLDAGAKIYSNRVDALHKEVIKLADEVILNQKKKQTENDMDADKSIECESSIKSKEKKKLNKKTMIVSSDSLKRKLKGKDPKDQFIKVEPLPGAWLSNVKRDKKDLSLLLENNVQFWPDWENYKPLKAEGLVSIPIVKIFRKATNVKACENSLCITLNQAPTTLNNGTDIIEDNQISSQETPSLSDFDHSHGYEDDDEKQSDDGKQSDVDVEVVSTALKRMNDEVGKNGFIRNTPSRLEALKLLFKETDDYNHLDTRNVHYWAGPEFWKMPTKVAHNCDKKQVITRRKKLPNEISYDNISLSEVDNILNKRGKSNQKRVISKETINRWRKNKLCIPKDLGITVKELTELFYVSRLCGDDQNTSDSFSTKNPSTQPDTNIETNGAEGTFLESSNDSDPLNNSFYEGPPGDHSDSSENRDPLNSAFYDVGLLPKPESHKPKSPGDEKGHEKVTVEMFSDDSPTNVEDFLVPAPKLINFQPIKYSTRPMRVNMLHLKDSMLNIIDQEIENVSLGNEIPSTSRPTEECADSSTPQTKFSTVLQKLPYVLEKNTAEDLSPAMAFVALLTLANENNFDLESSDNYSDVIVKRLNNTHF